MPMYCEGCSSLFEESSSKCPLCGSKKVRIPAPDDPCFLVEKDAIWGEVLADVLKQNNIPFYNKKLLGAGLEMNIGLAFERYKFYVPFSQVSQAQELVEALFTPVEDKEEE